MRILIRQQAADGTWKETICEGSRLTLGRATQQMLQLPGLMVALEHAELQMAGAGHYRLSSKALTGVEFEGRTGVREAIVSTGSEFVLGGHQLRIETPTPGFDLFIVVTLASTGQAVSRAPARLDLDSGGLSKRRPALALVVALLVLGLLIPLVLIAVGRPAMLSSILPTDMAWSSGPVTSSHAHFGGDCQACHATPFRSIQDTSCTSCHADIKHHSDHPGIGDLPGFKDRRCADCHQEHRGEAALISQNPALCTGCHARPEKLAGFDGMPPVKDFRREHPAFRYTVSTLSADGSTLKETRVMAGADGKVQDVSGSLFPHDSHVAAAGIKGPNGNEKLVCSSCHVADTAKAGFRDLDFQKHCQRCHELKLVTPERTLELPHGQNDASRFLVEMFYVPSVRQQAATAAASEAATPDGDGNRRRIGDAGGDAANPEPASTGPDSRTLVSEVFEYQVCGKCHLIDNTGEHPKVIPPKLRHTWLPAARFSHAPHNAVPCSDCHQVDKSLTGTDLNLPGIETCRQCHAGTHDQDGVASTCVSCHAMHRADQQLMSKAPDTAAPVPAAALLPALPTTGAAP